MSKEIIQKVVRILESSNYFDPAEHLYDGLKVIRRNPNNIHDFLWALESPTVIDFDGKVKQCADMIRPLLKQNKTKKMSKDYLDKWEERQKQNIEKIKPKQMSHPIPKLKWWQMLIGGFKGRRY